MRSDLKRDGLKGKVRSAQTLLLDMSTKSYRLRASGREVLQDFGNPSQGSRDSPLLWESLEFDEKGRLVEEINLDRSLTEQESYRYVYRYEQDLLVRKDGYGESGSLELRTEYRYDRNGRRVEQLNYSPDRRLQSRYEFDEHGNFTSVEWYNADGTLRERVAHRYAYSRNGNILEQNYYPPEVPGAVGIPLLGMHPEASAESRGPIFYRTVFVCDELGHLREETRYDADGSLHEKKLWDENGILQSKEWRTGNVLVTKTVCDDQGREVEIHTVAERNFLSSRAVDDTTAFSYDDKGNLISMVTTSSEGSLIKATTNVFSYDSEGNWVSKTETELTNNWKTEPFHAAFETVREFLRTITYFP